MPPVLLTKRIEFAASHRYCRSEWDEDQNRAVFGLCFNEPGHGHNYMLEVTVAGNVDPRTGMVVNLFDLKQVLLTVLEEFDHKHLNLDVPDFRDRVPTSENIAVILWAKLASQKHIGTLHAIRLFEDEDLYADVSEQLGLDRARVTRRYALASPAAVPRAAPSPRNGPVWDLFVTIEGPIDPATGMVTDLTSLDQAVLLEVIKPLEAQAGSGAAGLVPLTGEQLAQTVWQRLVGLIRGGALKHIRLEQSRDLAFERAG